MNEKLVINANLLRKEPEFGTRVCVVEKAEAVTHDKFERLKRHPMQDNDLIAENTDLMFCDVNNQYHCLLIYDDDQGDGLLIESEGAPYARYAQYIPNAKLLYENHMQMHLQEMKFYCPLEISRWDDDEYNEISPNEASAYESEINYFISDFNLPEEKERGLMHWYNRGNLLTKRCFRHLCLSKKMTKNLWELLQQAFTVSLRKMNLKISVNILSVSSATVQERVWNKDR